MIHWCLSSYGIVAGASEKRERWCLGLGGRKREKGKLVVLWGLVSEADLGAGGKAGEVAYSARWEGGRKRKKYGGVTAASRGRGR